MKAYRKRIEYTFKCRGCDSLIEAESTEFEVLDVGLVGYHCPVCKKRRKIRTKYMTRNVTYIQEENKAQT